MIYNEKNIVIVEGADASGKSRLVNHMKNKVNGKCHIFHSNFDKYLPVSNYKRQHILITKFIKKLFDSRYYTGNRMIILDRNYISDIIYGLAINCGSKGSYKNKMKFLEKLLKKLIHLDTLVNITIVYCRPEISSFGNNSREELPSVEEHKKVQKCYDDFFNSLDFKDLIQNRLSNKISYIKYDYVKDSDYKEFDNKVMINKINMKEENIDKIEKGKVKING